MNTRSQLPRTKELASRVPAIIKKKVLLSSEAEVVLMLATSTKNVDIHIEVKTSPPTKIANKTAGECELKVKAAFFHPSVPEDELHPVVGRKPKRWPSKG